MRPSCIRGLWKSTKQSPQTLGLVTEHYNFSKMEILRMLNSLSRAKSHAHRIVVYRMPLKHPFKQAKRIFVTTSAQIHPLCEHCKCTQAQRRLWSSVFMKACELPIFFLDFALTQTCLEDTHYTHSSTESFFHCMSWGRGNCSQWFGDEGIELRAVYQSALWFL